MARKNVLVCPSWGPNVCVEVFVGAEHREPSAPREQTLSGTVFLGKVIWRPDATGPLRSGPILLKAFQGSSSLVTCVREASVLARANGWPEAQHVHHVGASAAEAEARGRAAARRAGREHPLGGALARSCLDGAFCPDGGAVVDRPHAFAPRMIAYSSHARFLAVGSIEEALSKAEAACRPRSESAMLYPVPAFCKLESVVVMQGLDSTLARLIDPCGGASGRGTLPEGAFVREFLAPSLLGAVRRCHEAGIAHLDIKPDNIGIHVSPARGTLRAVLIDFGLSFVFPKDGGIPPPTVPAMGAGVEDGAPPRVTGATEDGARCVALRRCGTTQYVPPEMLLSTQREVGAPAVTTVDTRRADVFSAVASIAEAVTGRRLPWADMHLIALAMMPAVAAKFPASDRHGPLRRKHTARQRAKELLSLATRNGGAWYNPAADSDAPGRPAQPRPVMRGNEAYARFCRDPAAVHSLAPGATAPAGGPASLAHLFEDDAELQRVTEAASHDGSPLDVGEFDAVAARVAERLASLTPPAFSSDLPVASRPLLLPTFSEYLHRPGKPGPDPTHGARADFFAFGLSFAGLDGLHLRHRALPHELLAHAYGSAAGLAPADDGLPPTESSQPATLAVIEARLREMLAKGATAAAEQRVADVVGKIAVALASPRGEAAADSDEAVAGEEEPSSDTPASGLSVAGGGAASAGTSISPLPPQRRIASPASWGDAAAVSTGSRLGGMIIRTSRFGEGHAMASATAMMGSAKATRDLVRRAASAGGAGARDGAMAVVGSGWAAVDDAAGALVQGSAAFDDRAALGSIEGIAAADAVPPPAPPLPEEGAEAAAGIDDAMRRHGIEAAGSSGHASAGSSSASSAWQSIADSVAWFVGGASPVPDPAPVAAVGATRGAATSPEFEMLKRLRVAAVTSARAGDTGEAEAVFAAEWEAALRRVAASCAARTPAVVAGARRMLGIGTPSWFGPAVEAAGSVASSPAVAELARTAAAIPLLRDVTNGAGAVVACDPSTALALSVGSVELLHAPGGLADAAARISGAARVFQAVSQTSAPVALFAPIAASTFGRTRTRIVLAVLEGARQPAGPPVRIAFRGAGLTALPGADGGDLDSDGSDAGTEDADPVALASPAGGPTPAATAGMTALDLRRAGGRGRPAVSGFGGWADSAMAHFDAASSGEAVLAMPSDDGQAKQAPEPGVLAAQASASASASASAGAGVAGPTAGVVAGVPGWASARLMAVELEASDVPGAGGAVTAVVLRRVDTLDLARSALELQALVDAASPQLESAPAGGAMGFWGTRTHAGAASEAERTAGFAVVPTASGSAFATLVGVLRASLAPLRPAPVA